jgi:hypothetical protein
MNAFVRGLSAELVKLAASTFPSSTPNDVSGEAPTQVYNDPVQTARAAVETTQGRWKSLPGNVSAPAAGPARKSVPAPETTPSPMQGYTT